MATPTQALLKHLSDNWSLSDISYQSLNVPYDSGKTRTGFTYNDAYIVPEIDLLTATALEVPVDTGAVQENYIFTVRLIVKRETGTQTSEAMVSQLKTLYDRKELTTNDVKFFFDPISAGQGFVVQDNKFFEVPVVLPFRVYL
jgi:hypothetical protein